MSSITSYTPLKKVIEYFRRPKNPPNVLEKEPPKEFIYDEKDTYFEDSVKRYFKRLEEDKRHRAQCEHLFKKDTLTEDTWRMSCIKCGKVKLL